MKRRFLLKCAAVAGVLALTACAVANRPQFPNTPPAATGTVDLLAPSAHWQMAGTERVDDEQGSGDLKVTATGLAIVNQDGSPAYDNPPVNLYGTRLEHSGDFSVSYRVTDRTADATINLMSSPPYVSDETRADTGTLSVTLTDGKLSAALSDQTTGRNSGGSNFAVTTTAHDTIGLSDKDGHIDLTFNGQPAGSFEDNGVFDTRENGDQLWFGADTDGSFTLETLTATGENGGSIKAIDTRQLMIPSTANSLATLATTRRADFQFGTAVATGPLVSDTKYRELLGNFNSFTTENAAKWQTIHPKPDSYNFTESDAIVNMAQKSGKSVYGHTLIFGEANPQWVEDLRNDPEALKAAAIDHIKTVMGRYKGKVKAWDVIDEPLADYDSAPGEFGLRKNIWYDALGPSYVETMLRTAHEADPAAELWISDFGMESDDERFETMLSLVDRLRAQGVPLNGISFQGHIDEGDTIKDDTRLDTDAIRSRIQTLAGRGLKSRFSEVDITNESEHAVVSDFVRTCLGEKACTGVTVWGATDKYSSSAEVNRQGLINYGSGLLWDTDYRPTQGVDDIRATLKR